MRSRFISEGHCRSGQVYEYEIVTRARRKISFDLLMVHKQKAEYIVAGDYISGVSILFQPAAKLLKANSLLYSCHFGFYSEHAYLMESDTQTVFKADRRAYSCTRLRNNRVTGLQRLGKSVSAWQGYSGLWLWLVTPFERVPYSSRGIRIKLQYPCSDIVRELSTHVEKNIDHVCYPAQVREFSPVGRSE